MRKGAAEQALGKTLVAAPHRCGAKCRPARPPMRRCAPVYDKAGASMNTTRRCSMQHQPVRVDGHSRATQTKSSEIEAWTLCPQVPQERPKVHEDAKVETRGLLNDKFRQQNLNICSQQCQESQILKQ